MSDFVLTELAKADLKDIARYTEKHWGRRQRLNYLKQLDEAFRLLASAPETGTDIHFIREGYRKDRINRHIIFYRIIPMRRLLIVRILHQRMDIGNRLKN
ncbi:type II toxin-antitoxin system RelE/ParE family toxin [Aliamphritea spongicola]|uniref:type II toxin-antitoxin system RelE/ParE family toxin n=1 Tax=Aliamphritea spongicola TaxID=707589 RepID=UPI00196B53E0|nr:type II toxin-antitoxin system RelE/ParE family toxin [Aliamphritea spongicola]MBN3563691.1 type II toxin-antitoxin system RelE/ParE family toxin [Aliamphritea spongicola]